MKMYYLILLMILCLSCTKNHIQNVKQYTIEQFLDTTTNFGISFSPDEKSILFTSDQSGVFNVYKIDIASNNIIQKTNSDSTANFMISFFPNDNRILFDADDEGNEIYHIYLKEKDGSVRDLTPFDKARSQFIKWNYDKKSFFFVSNKRNPKYMDLFEMNIKDFKSKIIFQNNDGYNIIDISNNNKLLLLSKTITSNNSDMFLYHLNNTNKLEHLSKHKGDIIFQPVTFSVDSKNILFLTDNDHEFKYLAQYNILTGEKKILQKYNWDIKYAKLSINGKYLIVGINSDATTKIRIFNYKTGKEVNLPEMPDGSVTSIKVSKSEELVAFYINNSTSPNDLFVYNFNTKVYQKLTESLNKNIDVNDLVTAQTVRFPSFDGLEIPSLLYIPKNLKKREKTAALIQVHGGPGGQSQVLYDATIQYLVNHEYVVLAVNNRGSSGYGKTFNKADDQKHGDHDLRDCVEAKKFLINTGMVDPEKIGIIGGSYGGYMVLAGLAFQPEEFAIGIDMFGISNWVRTLESIPAWWEAARNALYNEIGDPESQRDMLKAKSPLFYAANISKPLLVLQGANDPRVLKIESDEIVQAVRKNNIPVEYIVFNDEGHGFRKKENRIKGYRAILKFADQYLKNN